MKWFRGVVWVLIVGTLLFGVYKVGALQGDVEDQETKTVAIEDMFADACGAASLAELREEDLVAECRLARADKLADTIPESPPEQDPIPDTTTADDATIEAVVADWFADHPLPDPQYQRRVEAAVTEYLTDNPPPPGPPPTDRQVQSAARTVLLANPPADGRGVASASLDGCSVVFTFTDGTTDAVSPVCGPPGPAGPPPTPEDLRAAVAAFCSANGGCAGPPGPAGPPGSAGPPGVVAADDACNPPAGEVVTDVSITYDAGAQTIRLTCSTVADLPGGGGPG